MIDSLKILYDNQDEKNPICTIYPKLNSFYGSTLFM